MASCLVPDLPAVNVALEHLGELDKQLRAERVSFSQEASHHLGEIAEVIKELEASRKATHEELEVETIETGKLRHRLQNLHDSIAAEISAAVAAARDASAAEIDELGLETARVLQEIASMERRRELLQERNALLLPEQELLNAGYAELLEALNRQLSEKADVQISLNETRNAVRSTTEAISRAHSSRKRLQDGLVGEKRRFGETKRMLEKELDETLLGVREQSEANAVLEEELDSVLSEFVKKEKKANGLSNRVSSLERRLAGLQTSQRKQEDQIRDKAERSDQLGHLRELREKELDELREALNLRLLGLREDIAMVERQTADAREENAARLGAVSDLSSAFTDQRKAEDDLLVERSNLNTELEKSKRRLEECFASIGKHKRDIKAMEEEMKRLEEENRLTAEVFKASLAEQEGRLVKEKSSRAALEVERDGLGVRVETLTERHEDRMRKLRSTAALHQTRYGELDKEKTKKRQEHESMISRVEDLTRRISGEQEESKRMEIKYKAEILQLSMEAESITRSRLDEEKELKDREMELLGTEAQFDMDLSRHRVLVKQTTELRARKDGLERSIRDAKDRTATARQQKEALKAALRTSREDRVQLLRSYGEQMGATERGIYESGQTLERVNMENCRLRLRIEQMKEEIWSARRETEKHARDVDRMKEETTSVYRCLSDAWVDDKLLTEECAETDRTSVEAMQMFVLQVQERKQHVGDINSRLEVELKAMRSLYDITNSQRETPVMQNEQVS